MAEQVVNVVAGKMVDSMFSKAKREIDYVRNCTKNVDALKNEAKKLKEMMGRIQQRIDVARRNGEALLDGVQNWMNKTGTEISKVNDFLEEEANTKKTCFNLRVCVNFATLYHYGKMAIDKTPVLLKQQEDGKIFENSVSIPTPTPGFVDLYQPKNYDDIDSHKLVLGRIIEALKDDSIQMVGIYGLGGVGKTTLAKEVSVQVKNLFADIVLITVSQTVDIEKIQKNVEVAAKRIMNGEKVLIILDDIWEKIDLPDLGIPCGNQHMNCKILLTSRSRDVCGAMKVDRNICVNILKEEEAWALFRRMVGETKAVNLEKIARAVIKECGGLPLIIQAVGNALKNKPIHIWEAALDRLQKHAPLEIAPEIKKAFTHLKLSYDLLDSKEAQSCFLLCSMFKEDEIIDMKRLAEYGVGLGIFDNPDSINDARKRVQIALDTLTSSCLLLSEEHRNIYGAEVIVHKMHDVVRDVALLITSSSSSEGEEKFLVKAGKDLKEWQPRKSDMTSTKISLMNNNIGELRIQDNQLNFPYLDTFLIRSNSLSSIPDEFFRGMKKVKVLDMSYNRITSLPQSLKLLTKLIMLDLSNNKYVKEISIVGELKELEILKVRGTGIAVIPEEIGQLTNLRVLDAEECLNLSDVTPGVISKLTCLEELYIGFFGSHQVSRFVLMEISNLKSLRDLHLLMGKKYDCQLFPEGTYFEGLPEFFLRFNFQMDGTSWFRFRPSILHLKRRLHITYANFPFTMPIKKLFQVSDGILLVGIKDLYNIIPDLYGESTNGLKSIALASCENVSCLVKTSDDDATQTFVTSSYDLIGQRKTSKEKFFSQVVEIRLELLCNLKLLFDCSFQYISLRNLGEIGIGNCDSLLTLFPLSVAQGLSNLRRIRIIGCESLMEVISARDEQKTGSDIEQTEDGEIKVGMHDDANIVFPSLNHISLVHMPKLINFYSGDSTVKYPSLERINVENCPSMKKWGYGVHDMPYLKYCNEEALKLFQ